MEALRSDLARLVSGGRASTDPADTAAYARDLWPRNVIATRKGIAAPSPPRVVVWPASIEEIRAVVRFAASRKIPLVPYGAGSGVCGGVLPARDSIVLDLKRMRALRRVDDALLEAEAEAGILGQHLEDALDARGLTMGHFPSSIYCSTLGGWVATRSAGQCSGRYGKIEDIVLALTCVDGRGEIHRVERDGPNAELMPLVIGSEGILAVVTDARVRIAPSPSRTFASFVFDDIEAGLDAIRKIYQSGLRPAVARLYDPFDSMLARRGHGRRARRPGTRPEGRSADPGLAGRVLRGMLRSPNVLNSLIEAAPGVFGGALLVLVFEADAAIARAENEAASAVAISAGGRSHGEGPARRWLARRHSVSYRQSPMFAAGAFVDTMEVAATWSRLVPLYHAVRAALSPHVFVMAHFSHAYPDGGSIYFSFAGAARDDDAATALYDRAWRDALAAAIDAGGTFSHHHGVGRSKAPAMRREQGAAVDIVRGLKREMDPAGVLNPGALIGGEEGAGGDPKIDADTPGREESSRSPRVSIDETSLIAYARAELPLDTLEAELAARGLTLGLTDLPRATVGEWLSRGAPGARDKADDPVAQLVAGLDFALPDGTLVSARPAPRRAVGPDLVSALVLGRSTLGAIAGAHLCVRRPSPAEQVALRFEADRMNDALAARAWIRGAGVRPRATEIRGGPEGVVLTVDLEGSEALRSVAADVVRRIGRERGARGA